MDFILIALAAAGASLLTFFSGFGLGTILTPVFILFLPIDAAIAVTGAVHFMNNAFKMALIGRHVHLRTALMFGLPAIAGSIAGAMSMIKLSESSQPWTLGALELDPLKVIIGLMMILFALWELIPWFSRIAFGKKALIPGGLLSGFFGGLSGHQGALRSAFLVRLALPKEVFIATGTLIACLVDIGRLGIYIPALRNHLSPEVLPLALTATGAAFAGAMAGKQLLKKITLASIQRIVGIMILLLGIGLITGWI